MFENIENLNKTASIAVSAFGVKGNAVFVQISENATYFICQSNKPKYTLRICRPNYHTFEELESEIQWLLNIDDVKICKAHFRKWGICQKNKWLLLYNVQIY